MAIMPRPPKYDAKFKPGDVVHVKASWDQGEEVWESGILLIEEHVPPWKHSPSGSYEVEALSGDIRWSMISAAYLDNLEAVELLGNINEDNTLKVLYGKS